MPILSAFTTDVELHGLFPVVYPLHDENPQRTAQIVRQYTTVNQAEMKAFISAY